jgi:hypothetical protein
MIVLDVLIELLAQLRVPALHHEAHRVTDESRPSQAIRTDKETRQRWVASTTTGTAASMTRPRKPERRRDKEAAAQERRAWMWRVIAAEVEGDIAVAAMVAFFLP